MTCWSFAAAATAVVFDPFESSMTDTRNGPKNASRTAARSRSPAAISVPPTKMAVWRRSFGPRVKDRAVHEIADRVGIHAAVTQNLVRASIERDHAVKNARVWRAVELQEQSAHGAVWSGTKHAHGDPYEALSALLANGCLAVLAPAITSSTDGSLASARWIASFVA